MKEKKKLSLAAQIFIALVLAVIAGLLMQKYANFAETYIKPFGTIFLNLLKFIVVPIVQPFPAWTSGMIRTLLPLVRS